jgi:hypothetical protein
MPVCANEVKVFRFSVTPPLTKHSQSKSTMSVTLVVFAYSLLRGNMATETG